MAAPVIAAVSEQDITIDTDYSLRVGITNDPAEVTVDGLLEGFAYTWHEDDDEVEIFGESTRLLGDAMWTVSAKETLTSTAVTSEITYNVVPSAPIIEEIGEITVYRGHVTDVFVEIQNKPTQIIADGLLLGLKSEADTEGESDNVTEGVRISGTVPNDAILTVDRADINIIASNNGGEDTDAGVLIISDETPVGSELAYIMVNIGRSLSSQGETFIRGYNISGDDGTLVTEHEVSFLLPAGITESNITADNDYFYIQNSEEIYKIARPRTVSDTLTIEETLTLPDDYGTTAHGGIALDADYFYSFYTSGATLGDEFRRFLRSNRTPNAQDELSLEREFRFLTSGQAFGSALDVDDTHIYHCDGSSFTSSNTRIFVIPKDTNNNVQITITDDITIESGTSDFQNVLGISIRNGKLYTSSRYRFSYASSRNRIGVYDLETRTLDKVIEINIGTNEGLVVA